MTDNLLGNGKLTLAARLAAVWGGVLATFGVGVTVWAGNFIWDYVQETRGTLVEVQLYISAQKERGEIGRQARAKLEEQVADHEKRMIRLEARAQ